MKNILFIFFALFSLNALADQFSALYDFVGLYEVTNCEFPGVKLGEKVEIKVFNNSEPENENKKEYVVAVRALDGFHPALDTSFVIRKTGNDRQLLNVLRERHEPGCRVGNSVVFFVPNHLEYKTNSRFYDLCLVPSFRKERSRKSLDLDADNLTYSRFSMARNIDLKCILSKAQL